MGIHAVVVQPCPPPLNSCVSVSAGLRVWVLHWWVGLSWVPIVGPADPILRVETASKVFFWHSTEIGSCCFPFGSLI